MYKKCQRGSPAQKQSAYGRALIELMKTTPYEEISVTDLAKAAGIARKRFYLYYEHKEDVVSLMVDEILMDVFQPIPILNQRELLVEYYRRWQPHRDLLILLFSHNLGSVIQRRISIWSWENKSERSDFSPLLSRGGTLRTDLIAAHSMVVLSYWCSDGYSKTPEELVDILLQHSLLLSPQDEIWKHGI